MKIVEENGSTVEPHIGQASCGKLDAMWKGFLTEDGAQTVYKEY